MNEEEIIKNINEMIELIEDECYISISEDIESIKGLLNYYHKYKEENNKQIEDNKLIIESNKIACKSLNKTIEKLQKELEEKTTILMAGADKVKQLEKESAELKGEKEEICIGKRSGKTYSKIQEMAKEIVKLQKENEELLEKLNNRIPKEKIEEQFDYFTSHNNNFNIADMELLKDKILGEI